MDTGIAIILAAVLTCHVAVLAWRREAVANPGLFRAANVATAVAILATVFGIGFLAAVVEHRSNAIVGGICLGAGMLVAGCAVLFLLLSLRLGPDRIRRAPVRERPANPEPVGPSANARSASFRQLYLKKKREVGRLRERVDELEEQARVELVLDPEDGGSTEELEEPADADGDEA